MAKAAKTIGAVVAVVGLAATGIGLAVGAGVFLGVAGATFTSIGMWAGLAAGAIAIGSAAFTPRPSFSSAGNPLQFVTNPQSGLPYPLGRTRMSGVRIHADTYDATAFKSEGKQDVLSFAVMLGAGGPMEEIETFRADKETVTFNPSTGAANGKYAGWMAQKWSLGLAGASALALAFGGANFPGWTSDHKLSGIAHALWDLRFDEKGDHYGAGVPEPEWIGKWVKAYDPRKDSTYPGGSGNHRALDESTYEWTRNPYLHALTWALGRWQNDKRTLGIGAPIEMIRVADFVEGANVADANGWHCGGVEWSTDSKWSVFKRMLQAGGGEPTQTGAMIGCRVNMPRVSIATIEPQHILDGLSYASTRSRRDRFNTVIPRYRSEAHDWEVISGSPVSVAEYVAEDGGARTKEIDFPLVQHEVDQVGVDGHAQAGELAAYEIANSREAGPIAFTVGPQFVGVKTGDVVTLDVPEEGFDAQPVLIRGRTVDPATFKITFTAETETAAKHDFALGKTTTPPPTWEPTPPDLTPPVPSAALWSLTASATGPGYPALIIAGVSEFPGADTVLIEYRETGAAEWQTPGAQDASSPVNLMLSPVEGGATYEARVAYKSGDRVGPWLALGPVTTVVDAIGSIAEDWNAGNNRNGAAIAAATIATNGTAVDHALKPNASADISFEWSWGGNNADIDGFEVMFRASTSSAAYTPGTTPADEEVWTVPANKRAAFRYGVNPSSWVTWAVRPYRVVDKDVNAAGIIRGAWVKPSRSDENPYRPSANVAFDGDVTGTIDGVPVADIVAGISNADQMADDFYEANNQNGTTPGAASNVQVSGVNYSDASGRTNVQWVYATSNTPGAANNIDGFLVGLMMRSSSAGYTYNPSDDNAILWHNVDRAARATNFPSTPVNQYRTAIVIPYRRVATNVAASGLIKGPAAQSSATTPYRQSSAPNFTGTIDGTTAQKISDSADLVDLAITDDGNIETGRVRTYSVYPDALNAANWVAQGATIVVGESETFSNTFLTMTPTGDHLVVQFIFDYQVSAEDPTTDEEFEFKANVWVKNNVTNANHYSDNITVSELWLNSSASGTKNFPRRTVMVEATFETLTSGQSHSIGYRFQTDPDMSVIFRGYRFLRADDRRAIA